MASKRKRGDIQEHDNSKQPKVGSKAELQQVLEEQRCIACQKVTLHLVQLTSCIHSICAFCFFNWYGCGFTCERKYNVHAERLNLSVEADFEPKGCPICRQGPIDFQGLIDPLKTKAVTVSLQHTSVIKSVASFLKVEVVEARYCAYCGIALTNAVMGTLHMLECKQRRLPCPLGCTWGWTMPSFVECVEVDFEDGSSHMSEDLMFWEVEKALMQHFHTSCKIETPCSICHKAVPMTQMIAHRQKHRETEGKLKEVKEIFNRMSIAQIRRILNGNIDEAHRALDVLLQVTSSKN